MIDKNKLAVNIFNKYANDYADKYMDVGLYHDSLNLFCDLMKKENASILELACGPGNITNYLLEQRPDFKILGTDLSTKMLELAKANNPKAEFKLMDARSLISLDKNYDGIICGFCMPYLSKEECLDLIKGSGGVLNKNGILYISTMEDDYEKSGFKKSSSGDGDEIYIYYHEADYLMAALENNNFTIIDLKRQECPLSDGTVFQDLIIVARNN